MSRKKWSLVLVTLIVSLFMLFVVTGAKKKEAVQGKKPLNEMVVGYVMPYMQGWFAYWDIGWKTVMDENGIETRKILTDWVPEKEIQAVRDFISQGVDAINVESGNPDAAQNMVQIANEAGIPIQIENSSVSPGPGVYIADIEFDWVGIGKLFGEKISQLWPGSKVVEIQGMAGFWPVEGQIIGMKEIMAKTGKYKRVALHYTDYAVETAMKIMRDIVQSGLEYDVVVCGTQEIAEGVIEVLKAEGLLHKKIVIVGNGGPLDVKNLEDGELDGCIVQTPGFHAMLCALSMIEFLKGNSVPKLVYSPVVWVTPKDYKTKAIPWQVDKSWIPVAQEFMKTGKLKY
jgi:ABC-type sugar transport system substrate-binding protein